jgi:anti-anti-sigma factor
MTAVDPARGPARARAEAGLSVLNWPAFTIARLGGDLDIATAPALRERLLNVFSPGMRLLIIDLSGVSFCDVSALAMLVGTQGRARRLGITVRLAAPRSQMAKLLRVTGLDGYFTICATLADACRVWQQDARLVANVRLHPVSPASSCARSRGVGHQPAPRPAQHGTIVARHGRTALTR